MEKFCEIAILIVLILLVYLVFRGEHFIQTVSETIKSREFNFKPDAHGRSQADYVLADLINK